MLMINLYINKSDNNVVNKNLEIIHGNIAYEMKTDTSVINPILIIDRALWNENINYVYVEELKRYFYIQDVTFSTGKLIMLSCHVDVLMSFNEQIKKCTGILERQETEANLYFNDSEFYALNKDEINTLKFPRGLEKNGALIMAVMGGN